MCFLLSVINMASIATRLNLLGTEVNVTAEFLCNMTLLLLTPFCRRSIKLTVTLSRTISLIIAVVKTQANSEGKERQLIAAARGCIVVSNN